MKQAGRDAMGSIAAYQKKSNDLAGMRQRASGDQHADRSTCGSINTMLARQNKKANR
ncbi:hypothetical protein [Achromobacter sp.]|uniref:hypothetical protein n=1 Tax=Achromobacter sp. TaxID=134375 RepID=UPI0028AD454C|nr:hypothetical protein [Achromobacter sp.]